MTSTRHRNANEASRAGYSRWHAASRGFGFLKAEPSRNVVQCHLHRNEGTFLFSRRTVYFTIIAAVLILCVVEAARIIMHYSHRPGREPAHAAAIPVGMQSWRLTLASRVT